MYLNIINVIYDRPIANISVGGENIKAIFLRSETRQEYPLSPLLFDIALEVLARAIRKKKKKKGEEEKKEKKKK